MKCFLVVNQLNDPCFIDHDESFASYIITKAKEKGLIEANVSPREIDPNLVMQLFSPLVLSQWLLVDQTKEPCSSITCQNGFCFVFSHADDLLFICIDGDGSESETFLHKKIQVFMTLMRFMFGPVNELMTQSHAYTKKARWDFLRQLMHNWSEMVETEQSFLVEAVERMHVNQIMNEKCVEILKKSIKHMQAARESTTQHAILLVKSKLLALYSNRSANELLAKDLLSLMILSKTLHPSTDTLEDLFSKNYTGLRSSSAPVNENADWGDEEYHSAPNTPKGVSPTLSSMPEPDTEPEGISQGLMDSLSVRSNSEADTIKNSKSFDLDNPNQSDSQDAVPSLIQMYKQKYPDSPFDDVVSPGPEQSLKTSSEEFSGKNSSPISYKDSVQHPNPTSLDKASVDQSAEYESLCPKPPPNSFQEDSLRGDSNPRTELRVLEEVNSLIHSKLKTDAGDGEDASQGLKIQKEGETDKLEKDSSDQENDQNMQVNQLDIDVSAVALNESPGFSSMSTYGEASRSSSAVSNVSTGYPMLSPHFDENSDFQSFPTSPVSELSTSTVMQSSPSPASPHNRETPKEIGTSSNLTKSISASVPRINRSKSVSTTESSTQTYESVSTMVSTRSSSDVYVPQTVFLETSTCLYSPYSVDILQVLPGLTLVLLSEVPHRILADTLYQVIHNIQDLLYGRRIKLPRSRSLNVYDIISSLLSKLHNSLKRFKGRIRGLIVEINSRWEKENLKQKLLDYLEKDTRAPIPPELESAMTELYKKLKELFSHMFLTPVLYASHVYEAVSQLKAVINAELMDYHGYLNVKVQRNITMTSYIDDFPGLVHFIFVDRHLHQMTAPSFNITLKEGESMDATSYLKKKIWTMHEFMMKKLMEGYTTVLIKDGDFYFSYFLWFEDYTGNPLPVQESLKPTWKRGIPGPLSGCFYTDLLQHCFPHAIKGSVHCFEMFLMHLGTVHPQFISSQCKKLAHKMWEMSGEAYTNVSLF